MLTLETTAQFRRDYRRVKKRGYKMALLAEVLAISSRIGCWYTA